MLKNPLWLFGITLIVLIVFLPSYTKMSDLRRKNGEFDQELIRMKKQGVLLGQEKRLLEDDPEYLEKVAREKMGLVKEGEVIYRLMPSNVVEVKEGESKPQTKAAKQSATTQTKPAVKKK